MMLADVRDYIGSLGIAEAVYMGKMDGKPDQAIGVYNSKHEHVYQTALGGKQNQSHGFKYVTLLVHWNKSPRDTEKAAKTLFSALEGAREVTISEETIKFIQLLVNEPVDTGTDDAGVYEMVIEAAFIYERRRNEE